jgi:hypothetical protein
MFSVTVSISVNAVSVINTHTHTYVMAANKHWAVAFVAGMTAPRGETREAVRARLQSADYANAAVEAEAGYHSGPWLTRLAEALRALGDEETARDLAVDCTAKRLLLAWSAEPGDKAVDKVYNKVINGQRLLKPEEIGAATYEAPPPAEKKRKRVDEADVAAPKRPRHEEPARPTAAVALPILIDEARIKKAVEETIRYYEAAAKLDVV